MENNFKTIKDSVTRIIFESHNTQNEELTSVWKNFISEVKVSPILKTLFVVYNNIENNKFEDRDTAEMFLNENLFSFGSFSKKQIMSENERIKAFISQHIIEAVEGDKLFDLILESAKDRKLSDLHKKAKLFTEVANSLIKESVIEEETVSVDPEVAKRAVAILNEKYSFFNETEKTILKAFLHGDEEKKKECYDQLIKENVNIIKRRQIEMEPDEDPELFELLNLTEAKLKSLEYNSEIKISDFSDLINFQKD